ncbi:unnamed protein product [Symbiodinium sp. CCMP2592]|nr:unnamed protein product [Symbiodinium sp. CCMP2592]
MIDHVVNGKVLTASASLLARLTGKEASVAQGTLVAAGAATAETNGIMLGSMLSDFCKIAVQQGLKPLLAVTKVRYDETPAKVRICRASFNDQASDGVREGSVSGDMSQCVIVPHACAKGPALQKFLLGNGASLSSHVAHVATHAKVLQTQVAMSFVFAEKDGDCHSLTFDLPCPLQVIERTTGECQRMCIWESLTQIPEYKRLVGGFQHQVRSVCTDRAGANFRTERGLQEWLPKQVLIHTPCDLHKAATAIKHTVRSCESDMSGLINSALVTRGDAGAMGRLREILLSILVSTTERVCDEFPPQGRISRHRMERFDLWLPTKHVGPSVAKQHRKRRFLLSNLLNGDLLSSVPQHYCPVGCCQSDDDFVGKLTSFGLCALLPRRMPLLSRKNWLNQTHAMEWAGCLESHHQLFSKIMIAYVGRPAAPPATATDGSAGSALDNAVQDFLLEDLSGNRSGEQAEAEQIPEPEPSVQEPSGEPEVLNAIHLVMTEFLALSSSAWEQKQAAKAALQQPRDYLVLQAARGTQIHRCMDKLVQVLCEERLDSVSFLACKFRALRFCSASSGLCCLHGLLRIPRRSITYQGFLLLDSRSHADAQKLLDTPPCLKDEFFSFMCRTFPSPMSLLGKDAMAILQATAASISVDIGEIESCHSLTRDFINVRAKGWVSSLETVSALHILQQRRKIVKMTTSRAADARATTQDMKKPGPKRKDSKEKKKGGGGGPWRAFVSYRLRGVRASSRDDDNIFADLAEEYQHLGDADRAWFADVGRAGTLAHKRGHRAFGDTSYARRIADGSDGRHDDAQRDAAADAAIVAHDAPRFDFGLVPVAGMDLAAKYSEFKEALEKEARASQGDPLALTVAEASKLDMISADTQALLVREAWERGGHAELQSNMTRQPSTPAIKHAYQWTPPTDKAVKAHQIQVDWQLHAAFDGREEAAELIEVFLPGINRDGKYQRADVLVTWARENESAIKRQRRESLHGMWEVLPQQRVVPKLTDTFDELARSNPLVLLPALQRKRRLLRENTDATQRAKEEQLAKKKYALQLAGILKEAKLPLVQQLEGVDQPEEVWPRIFGTRRSKTLRNRLKAWQPFRTWLQCVHDVQWPTSVRQLIDYSNERFQSECGKTVLNSFQASLAVLEQVGKVAETQRLSSDTTWLAHLKSLTADLVGEQAPVQQAPMMTVAMIISLELHIAREDEPEYVRAMAFVALLAVYGSMRMDDLQGILPATMRLTAQGFRATLGRTKTTGADRRNKEVTVFIHRQAGLSGFDWLGEGFALWKKYTQPRDYLVMTARDDWKGPTKHFAKTEVVAGYVREVFKRLATPKFQDGAYRLNLQRYLLVEGAQGFFTGHSPRNWLTSAAAVLGWSKDQRDFLGRWLIGGSGSADYTRTSREVVRRIQIGVCRAIVTGQGGEYQEIEALEELKAYVDERGGSGALARRRHDIFRTVGGARCLGNKWPVIELDDADASEEEEAAEALTVEGSATKYFISISRKTGHRRLHLNGCDTYLTDSQCARTAARDFGINPDTPAGRVEVAAIVAAWELAKEYASKEIELRAEAKVLGHKRILQVQERQAMLKAVTDAYGKMNESETPSAEYLATKAEECESNEPLASSLDRISSKKDSQVESLQTSIDPTGHVRVTKTMQKLEMPHHSEGYRRLMKVEAHAWLCMSARFKAKGWLQGLQLEDFTRFVEYILGDRVGNLKLPTASGQETQFNRPPWNIVLSYEYKLRVEAFKMILEGTATMSEALRAVREDPSLKEAYFTTPLALHTAGTPTKFRKGNHKGKDKTPGQEIPPPPAPHQNGRGTGKGKGKKGKGQVVLANGKQLALVSATPDGRQLCYAYNHQGCTDPKCTRVHACRVAGCFAEHPASQHDSSMQKVTSANHFVDQCLKATVFAAEAGNFFVWEAPEHFGRTADGLVPSSIWAWPELLDCIPRFAATTFVHYLCEFGADMAKPTRYLSNLPFFRHSPRPFNGMPVLDADQRYIGPLPASCPHGGHSPSTGKSQATQKWNLPRARGWPLQLCQFMVAAIDFSLQADGECKSSKSKVPDKVVKVPVGFFSFKLQYRGCSPHAHPLKSLGDPESAASKLLATPGLLERRRVLELFDMLPREEPPRESTTATPGSSFATGAYCKGGLVGLRHHSTVLPKSTQVLTRYLQQVAPGFQASAIAIFDDVRTGVHRDARNAHYPNMVVPLSDFEDGQIWLEQQGGDVWETTPEGRRPGVHLEVCKGPVSFDAWRSYHATRPWKGRRVVMVAYMTDKLGNVEAADLAHLKALGFKLPLDSDASNGETSEVLDKAEGLSTGDTAPPVPFRPEACGNRGNPIRVEWEGQEADMTDGPMDRGHRLGPAATAHAQSMYRMLTNFISEHVPDPRRFCLSLLSGKVESSPFAGEKLEALRKQWAEVLGAENNPDVLEIPDAQPFLLRALSLSAERLEDPDWQILTEGVDCFCTGEIPLAATADVSAAHRLVLHRKSDWALMSCRAEQGSDTIWINKVGTFGLSPASFWWSRLYGIIGRVVTRCLLQHAFYHFAYVDDVHPTFYGKRMFINFLVWLILQELIGVPFAYHKFKGKTLVAFIGYELDYGARLVGLSEARGAWVCNWVDEARKARFVVSVRKFAEFLGRLGFVSRVVYWIKPHLAPLYAWSAAASKSHVAKMPDTVILTLLYLEATLKDINFKVAPGRQREETGHLFHTDAKCADGYVVLGGWDSSQDLSVAPWFSIVVKPADAPYLFDEDGKSQWASASAELLATLAALWIFGHLKESSSQRRLPVAIAGATDNQSNEKLLRKQSTTKWPLMLINMQLSHLLRKACLRLSLTWKPRDENKLADALTNQDFSSFSSEHRLDVSFSELPLELLNQLWSSKSDFDASRKALQSASSFQPRVPKRKREGTPW